MKATIPLICVVLASIHVTALRGVMIGQVDTFEDGTTAGWHIGDMGHPLPPANASTGGPDGADDNFLTLRAIGGAGPGSRLSVLSGAQWAGDYLAAGITHLVMDVNNFGPDDLHLRLLFEDLPVAAPPTNLALSADAVLVPAGSGWRRVAFDISPAGLLPGIFGTVEGALMSTDVIRLFHNPDATFPGPGIGIAPVSVELGVDNITAAAAVPDTPVTGAALLMLGLLCVAAAIRRRRDG